jgi:hypothetical protein
LTQRLVLLVLLALTSGCGPACIGRTRAEDLSRRLREHSLERSAGVMRDAATKLGATLLTDRVTTWTAPWDCATCEPWWAASASPLSRIDDPEGTPHVVIAVPDDGRTAYTRLARRGNTLLLLVPHVVRRTVGEKSACECNAGLVFLRPTYVAFVLDDVAVSELERVTVNVTEDYIRWHCKANLVRNGHECEPRKYDWEG